MNAECQMLAVPELNPSMIYAFDMLIFQSLEIAEAIRNAFIT